jgi:hypothetical protein
VFLALPEKNGAVRQSSRVSAGIRIGIDKRFARFSDILRENSPKGFGFPNGQPLTSTHIKLYHYITRPPTNQEFQKNKNHEFDRVGAIGFVDSAQSVAHPTVPDSSDAPFPFAQRENF